VGFGEGGGAEIRSKQGRLVNPSAARNRKPSRPPLSIGDVRLQAIVDRSWSRRERWLSFSEIAGLVQEHDPDEGRLPDLLRAYLDQNILQPYFDGDTRDPRFWTMLGLAADHIEFIDFVRSYARLHPSSRATTDLLFLLDELAQGSRDAFLMLMDTDPRSDLRVTRLVDRDAYDLAMAIRREYDTWLQQQKLTSADEINAPIRPDPTAAPHHDHRLDTRRLPSCRCEVSRRRDPFQPEASARGSELLAAHHAEPARQLCRRVLTSTAGVALDSRRERTGDRPHSSCRAWPMADVLVRSATTVR